MYVVKISVSKGQARITIPREIAIWANLLTEDGKQGKFTHAIVREVAKTEGLSGIIILPTKMDIEEE